MQSDTAFVLEFLHAFTHRSGFTLRSQATRKGLIPTGSIGYCMSSSGFVFHASFFKYFHLCLFVALRGWVLCWKDCYRQRNCGPQRFRTVAQVAIAALANTGPPATS